jgi:hypothetical protein
MTTSAYATQVVPRYVEFTDDNIEQGGKPQVCVVTVAITNPPEPEVVNYSIYGFYQRAVRVQGYSRRYELE